MPRSVPLSPMEAPISVVVIHRTCKALKKTRSKTRKQCERYIGIFLRAGERINFFVKCLYVKERNAYGCVKRYCGLDKGVKLFASRGSPFKSFDLYSPN